MIRAWLNFSVSIGVAATLGACGLKLKSNSASGILASRAFGSGQVVPNPASAVQSASADQNCPIDEAGLPHCPPSPTPSPNPNPQPTQSPSHSIPVDIGVPCPEVELGLQADPKEIPLDVVLYDLGPNPTNVNVDLWHSSRKVGMIPSGFFGPLPSSIDNTGLFNPFPQPKVFSSATSITVSDINVGDTYAVYLCAWENSCWVPSARATSLFSQSSTPTGADQSQLAIAAISQLVSGRDLASGKRVTLNLACQPPLDEEKYIDPLALSITGGSINLSSAAGGVKFDMNNNNEPVQMAWPQDYGNGFLVRLKPGESEVTNGSQLFGTSTRLPDGSLASSGFQALAALDSDQDGKITPADAQFDQLFIWYNPFTDGRVARPQEMALISLQQAGVTEIDLSYVAVSEVDGNGNQTSYRSAIDFGAKQGILFDVLLLSQ